MGSSIRSTVLVGVLLNLSWVDSHWNECCYLIIESYYERNGIKMTTDQFLKELFSSSSVFQDESVFSLDYIPKELIHREEELRELLGYFREVLRHPFNSYRTVMIYGPVGSGKTALARNFGHVVEKWKDHFTINSMKYVHINCRKTRSVSLILTQILGNFIPFFPIRGFSSQELLRQFKEIIQQRSLHIFLTLDEVDYIFRDQEIGKVNDLLYTLSRMNEESSIMKGRLSLILATRDRNFQSYLDDSTQSSLARNKIILESYTETQLKDILSVRANNGFSEGVVDDEVIRLAAKVASRANGDARYALDLLWRAGKKADQEKVSRVFCEHVRLAQFSVSQLSKQLFSSLQVREKSLLLGVCSALTDAATASVPSSVLKNYLCTINESYSVDVPEKGEIPQFLEHLSNIGILHVEELSNKPNDMQISLLDVPISILQEILNYN